MSTEQPEQPQESPLQAIQPIPQPLPEWFDVTNDETGETRRYVDYSAGFQNVTGYLQWGADF